MEVLLAKSCLVDGEGIVRDENGLAGFDLIMATTCLRCCCSLIRNCVSATRCSRLIAMDREHNTSDEIGVVGEEKSDRPGDLFGLARPKLMSRADPLHIFRVIAKDREQAARQKCFAATRLLPSQRYPLNLQTGGTAGSDGRVRNATHHRLQPYRA